MGTGLSATWTGVAGNVALSKTTLQLAPASISITAATAAEPLQQALLLWDEPTTTRRSSVAFEAPTGATIYYLSQPGSEMVLAFGSAVAHLDRPVAVDGGRLAVAMPNALLALLQTAAGTQG